MCAVVQNVPLIGPDIVFFFFFFRLRIYIILNLDHLFRLEGIEQRMGRIPTKEIITGTMGKVNTITTCLWRTRGRRLELLSRTGPCR